jgi:LPS export ABC transporter protein LptC/lipopolysaccharide transport protein LptA
VSSQWFSFITLLAALLIGYAVITTRDGEDDTTAVQAVLAGYHLKNAVIIETAADGSPQVRFAADEVVQSLNADGVALTSVRIDYQQAAADADGRPTRWVLNADRASVPAQAQRASQPVRLRGNVQAHSVGAPHDAVLNTDTLDIDTERQIATTSDLVDIDLDGHSARGRGLFVNMQTHQVRLRSQVALRFAAQPTAAITPGTPKPAPKISLPNIFESEELELNQDEVLTLKKVRSVTPPFVSADQARATGADLANNQVVLTGAVRIELPEQGTINADEATVTVRDDRVVRAIVTGAPVNLEHHPKDGGATVYGRASRVDYDVPAQSVLFSGDAWFTKGEYDFKSHSIIYDLATGAVRASRGTIGLGPRTDDISKPEQR